MANSDSTQLSPRVKNEVGNVYGKLTVVSYAGINLKALKGAYWHCQCECGNTTVVCGRALRNKTIRTCGCSKLGANETGNVYRKLTVLRFVGKTKSGDSLWECQCECGKLTTVPRGDLRRASTVSCGCHRARSGGMCNSTEYTSWQEMKRRCYNTSNKEYHNYGGRDDGAITICDRWLNSFVAFLEDVGKKPSPEHTIHRVNNDGNYEPGNVVWATPLEQGQNTRKARMLTYNGETRCLRDWARKLGITHMTLSVRLSKGWPLDKVFSSEHYFTPPPIKKARTPTSG